jgi:hypothetical protein
MRAILTVGLVCLSSALFSCQPAGAEEVNAAYHRWKYIAYPRLPAMPGGSRAPILSIQNGDEDGLQLVIAYTVLSKADKAQNEPPAANQMAVRLHLGDGRKVDPRPDEASGPHVFGDSRALVHNYTYRFRWGRNLLDEAWVEVSLPQRTYWLEMPYGFTRNPREQLASASSRPGRPTRPPTMNPQPKDVLVPWLRVHYDLGGIQNGWRLSAAMANPFDADAEIVLYRDDSEVGKSMYLWDLHSPRTSMLIKDPAQVLQSREMSIRLHEDGMRRSDNFKFSRYGRSEDRCWGTAIVKVDDKTYEFTVPSSLFKYTHGLVDPYDAARFRENSNR